MPADETTNAVPNTRIVTIGRQARAELSSLRFPFKRLVSVRGATRFGLAACYALAACSCLVKIATQLECDARKPSAPFDASRDRFDDVAAEKKYELERFRGLAATKADEGSDDFSAKAIEERAFRQEGGGFAGLGNLVARVNALGAIAKEVSRKSAKSATAAPDAEEWERRSSLQYV